MATQVKVQKPHETEHKDDALTTGERVDGELARKRAGALAEELDEILDEVDALLDSNEEFKNTEAFLDAFTQVGGE